MPRADMIGKRFGLLVVVSYAGPSERREGKPTWLCRCDCGNEKIAFGGDLRIGNTSSCGCLRRPSLHAGVCKSIGRIACNPDVCHPVIGKTDMCPNGLVIEFGDIRLTDHFWSRVSQCDAGCWIWTGRSRPYGEATYAGRAWPAHRLSYETLVSPVQAGLELDHLCRVKRCVNPAHLEPVTHAENIRRAVSSSSKKTHCPQGHPYDELNTHINPSGYRTCSACVSARTARRAAERIAARLAAKESR